ncbi:glycoside hydrolase family 43 protein [Natronoflexus pectinivorans]|uniref:Beta-xylosidase n=1 Tax=Natronoflexus pectinivorans TaxID=682526 RepID=A0A4R2GNR0_9BACT|nr:glycoside hydrolase 43 family protein [Natronoflexus pectinivorans]TCO10667.1 beta-xylosidase [Natronoflexus pectinivorans]
MKSFLSLFLVVFLIAGCKSQTSIGDAKERATNPVIWADVPDVAMVRVGDVYYSASTTMHMNPGLPIMKSYDLINWEIISYAYNSLVDNDAMNLENDQRSYGRGSWAPSIRYHNGMFYASTFSATSGKTHIYTTRDPENEPWKEISFSPVLHDHSLVFDNGKVYMLYGGGDVRIVELKDDLSGIKPNGINKIIIAEAGKVVAEDLMLPAEGTQLYKHDGMYYVFNITWPRNGMRTVLVHRAKEITGPYEGRVLLSDRGIAQGSVIDTPEGDWYAYMFRDFGSVGRIPYLMPMRWEDGWPVLGIDGVVPDTLDLPASRGLMPGIVSSDDFKRGANDPDLPLVWQWNHNPVNELWSVREREGFLRLRTGTVVDELQKARNTLTQRTFGPVSSASTVIEVDNMKEGDFAGLTAFQRMYGKVGVKYENGVKSVFMISNQGDTLEEIESFPLDQSTVYLKVECDFRDRADVARFFYSLNGKDWEQIGNELNMQYTLMEHFMGYRFGLFNYATKSSGGYVDFGHYKISDSISW